MKTEKRRIIYSMVASLALGTMAVNAADIEQILPTVADAFTVDSNGTERMRVNGDGNVGIGTTMPAKKLTVLLDDLTKTVSDQQDISVLQINQRLADGSFDNSRTLAVSAIDNKMGIYAGYHHGATNLTLGTYRHKEAIVVEDMTGNVGIGTTTPTSKLAVVGLPVFADNTAAAALTAGDFYRTATGVLMVKF